jgi:metal-sulfur cluster biosynthetic enzyme
VTSEAEVLAALGTVRDPELDESIVELGFVASVDVHGEAVAVRLRLPTYFCAPNFAYLMVADAHDAVATLPGVGSAEIALTDHFAAEEINAGVAADRGFAATFDGLADDELDDLRLTFRRKAFLARQDRLARALLAEGRTPEDLARMCLADLPDSAEVAMYRGRRAELGLDCSDEAPLLVDADGRPPEDVAALLLRGRTTRVSVEGNAGLCRGLLQTRYAQEVRG